MEKLKDILSQAVVFEKKIDPSDGKIIENKPLRISWKSSYKDLESIADEIVPFEFGVSYDLGVRTLGNEIMEQWTVRGSLDHNDKVDNFRATIGWNEGGHEKLLKYRKILTTLLGQPNEEVDNFEDYSEAFKSWGPYDRWTFGKITLTLWGTDFRNSTWYKIDIENKQYTKKPKTK